MGAIQRFARNERGRDFLVGDIHGAYDLVIDAMKKAGFDPKVDRLFSVGDLIDRGAGSHRAAKFLSMPYVHAVRGNHEDMLLDLYKDGEPQEYVLKIAARFNGFAWWLDTTHTVRQEILDAIRDLPLAIEIETERGTVGLIHADVPPGMDWATFCSRLEVGDERVVRTCLWGRDRVKKSDSSGVAGIGRIFAGHTRQSGIKHLGNIYYVDTSAYAGERDGAGNGHLTMAQIAMKTSSLVAPRAVTSLVDLRDGPVPSALPFGGSSLSLSAR